MTPVKDFYFDSEPLLLPVGTEKTHDATNWALYYNPIEDVSFVVTRGKKGGKLGWRIRSVFGEMRLSSAEHYVKTSCGECLKL
jgi:hypothetical protein